MKKVILVLFTLFLHTSIFARSDISVDLTIEQYEATLLDSIQMIIRVSGTRDAETPRIHGLSNFITREGGTSTRMEYINGKYSSSVNYTYFLQPKREGTFKIGPAEVKVDGSVYRSDVKKITVMKSAEHKGDSSREVFLTANLSSKKAYVEEQLTYSLKLYHLIKVANVSLSLPDNKNLSFKQIGKPIKYKSIYNSRTYQVIEVRYSIIPSRTGEYNIDPAKMSMTVFHQEKGSRRRDRMFDDFFSGDSFFSHSRGSSISMASESLNFNVLSIPDKGKPIDFSGLIGSFRINSKLEPSRIKAGESATFTVTVSGSGNVNHIPDLRVMEIRHAKIYADQPTLSASPGEKGMEGAKTMKWAIVPENEGEYNIPPLSLSFFDTAKEVYKEIKTIPYILTVLPGGHKQPGDTQSPGGKDYALKKRKEIIEELGKDIFPIHSSIRDFSSLFQSDTPGWIYWLLLGFPVFVYAAFVGGFKLTKKTPQKIAQIRASKAVEKLIKKCTEKDISANSLSDALRNYINDRFGMELGSISPYDAGSVLRSKGCSEEAAEQMEDVLLKIENIIYTGRGDNACDIKEKTSKLINRIEKEIK